MVGDNSTESQTGRGRGGNYTEREIQFNPTELANAMVQLSRYFDCSGLPIVLYCFYGLALCITHLIWQNKSNHQWKDETVTSPKIPNPLTNHLILRTSIILRTSASPFSHNVTYLLSNSNDEDFKKEMEFIRASYIAKSGEGKRNWEYSPNFKPRPLPMAKAVSYTHLTLPTKRIV